MGGCAWLGAACGAQWLCMAGWCMLHCNTRQALLLAAHSDSPELGAACLVAASVAGFLIRLTVCMAFDATALLAGARPAGRCPSLQAAEPATQWLVLPPASQSACRLLEPLCCWLLQDLLVETHAHLARKQAQEGNFREAEKHFVEARDWQGALQMYQGAELWDAALRMAKQYGGAQAVAQVRLWGAVKAAAAAWK